MTGTLRQLVDQLVNYAPKVLSAILIVIVGYIVSKFIAGIIRKFLEKLKIDRFGENLNDIDIISKSGITVKISAIFSKFIYYFLFLFFLVAASDVLGMPAISNLVVGLFNFIPKLLVGLVILIFGTLLAEGIRSLIEATLLSLGIPSAKIIASITFYFLFINIVVVAISQAEIQTDFLQQNISIIIAGGVLAFAIGYGLASRDVVANFLSSFYAKNKVKIGDTVTIDGDKGEITDMDNNSFTISSDNNKTIYPLKILLTEKITIHE